MEEDAQGAGAGPRPRMARRKLELIMPSIITVIIIKGTMMTEGIITIITTGITRKSHSTHRGQRRSPLRWGKSEAAGNGYDGSPPPQDHFKKRSWRCRQLCCADHP